MLTIVPPAANGLLRVVGATLDIREQVPDHVSPRTRDHGGAIYVAWHSRLLLGMYYYRGVSVNVLVSRSRDGELLSRALTRFGFEPIRGSSSRGAVGSLMSLARVIEKGKHVMIAPDGPRGPREEAKSGAIQLAALSGAPIYPWTWCGSSYFCLKTWDRLRIPLPFSRCVIICGEAIHVPKNASRDQLESKRQELKTALDKLKAREREEFPWHAGID